MVKNKLTQPYDTRLSTQLVYLERLENVRNKSTKKKFKTSFQDLNIKNISSISEKQR